MKKKDFDIVGILLGIIIGILLGYFISTKIDIGATSEVGGKAKEEDNIGYVYLLQIAKFDNPDGPVKYLEALKLKELDAVVVYDKTYYYIYGGITASESLLAETRSLYETKGYTTLIKKEFILDKPNAVLDDNIKYDFWTECINNLIHSLKNESFSIDEKYYLNPIDLEAFSSMTILQSIKNDTFKNKVRLQLYKKIIENLN